MGDESNAGYLQVDSIPDGCCVTVRLSGEVDIASVDQIRTATRNARDQHDASHLIVDCQGLDFLDSSGVKAFLEAHDAFAGKVVLVRPRRVVSRVFEVTGLDELFAVADSVDRAQEAVHAM
ncbi:MAG: STAS domain-containing protein [Acidimicrobiia bacterium]